MRGHSLVFVIVALIGGATLGAMQLAQAREPVVFKRWVNIEAHDHAPVVYEEDLETK